MGANAQTTVPTFTTGQVLTATQMNDSARTGVPVFAGTVERDAAFGGTGEKTLAEGQLCYLESTNVVQYYDGAAWATVGPASAGGLVYLTGASFSAVTSVSLPNSTFTSTYRNYRLVFDITTNTADSTYTLRYRASGSDNTTSNYFQTSVGITHSGTGVNLAEISQSSNTIALQNDSAPLNLILDIIDPQLSEITRAAGALNYQTQAGEVASRNVQLWFNATTVFDALSIISSTATNMSGVYRVYGYADS